MPERKWQSRCQPLPPNPSGQQRIPDRILSVVVVKSSIRKPILIGRLSPRAMFNLPFYYSIQSCKTDVTGQI